MDSRLIVVLVALLALLLLALYRYRRRVADRSRIAAARERALRVTEAALETYRLARSQDPSLGAEDLKLRVLTTVSGETEAQVRARIEKARGVSARHATLQMLLVDVAVRQERELEDQLGSEQVLQSVAEVQKVVLTLVPSDL
jgi:hypothetical protein